MPPAFSVRALILLGLVSAERVFELWLSRRHIARSTSDPGQPGSGRARAAGSSADWIAMVAVHTALIVLPALEVAVFGARARDALFWSASIVFLLAQALRYWSVRTLGRAWNARAVVDPDLGFVSAGPYRWIRHPNYLAVLLDFTCVPLALGAFGSWIVLNLLHAPVIARRIRAEEALLETVPGYAQEMRDKGRFLPRLSALRRRAARGRA